MSLIVVSLCADITDFSVILSVFFLKYIEEHIGCYQKSKRFSFNSTTRIYCSNSKASFLVLKPLRMIRIRFW